MQMSQKNIRLRNVAFFTVIVAMSCFSTMAKSEIVLEVGGITYADPSVTALTHELVALNQSRLVRKQAAVQRFRDMFSKYPEDKPSILEEFGSAQNRPTTVTKKPVKIDTRKSAVEQLKLRISARKKPSMLVPFGTINRALYHISNGMNELMIRNLESGQLPIVDKSGSVIGTKDPKSGLLTTGKGTPKENY